jgi:hypothetical protein
MADHRANYALVTLQEHLGPDREGLDVPWATFSGDHTDSHRFEVPGESVDPYVQMQVYDVGEYGHELLLNGEALSGFDVPPGTGWQHWMDTVTAAELTEGENTIQFQRDAESDDSFVVGTVTVNWKERI